ncbi:21281_t:CDS:2 [Gigaspora margarita]|uniref:Autophagy-related protein n=1 Tax=Gigaspora margarita TaxID=4874 RepID=A0ABN7V9Y3_GIGMA|nr:21281_t:CDS:2 [Gigaspora margarita]
MLNDDLPVTQKELRGWYLYNLACEVYYVAAITVFIPIILENLASDAGFELDHVTPCNKSQINYKCDVKFGPIFVDTASYSLFIISISVFLQAIIYIAFGSLADHGNNQKKFLLTFSYIGALSTTAFITILSPELYWLAGLLTIISNVSFGTAFVFYLAYIPTFTRVHPRVIDAKNAGKSSDEINKVEEEIANEISSKSLIIGCFAGVLILTLCAGVVRLMHEAPYSYRVSTAICGVWWLLNLTFPLLWLKDRKSPPLPSGENFVFYSWKRVAKTIASTRQLWQTMKFLMAWFLLSDGFNTIVSVAILFGQKQLGLSLMELLITAIIIPICIFCGAYVILKIQQYFDLRTKTMILITASLHSLIPIYGLIGFVAPFGLKNTWEVWMFAVYFGFLLGAIQSYCRVLFGSIMPRGHENELFSLYEITDKGSSWLGPLVTGLISNATHDLRYTYWFLLVMMTVPIAIIYTVDVQKGKDDAESFVKKEYEILGQKKPSVVKDIII